MTWTNDPPPDTTGVFDVEVRCTVRVTVTDPDVVRRCVENHDDRGVPQRDVQGGEGWWNVYYPTKTRDAVLAHLACNAVANHLRRAVDLDGWADVEPDAAIMSLEDVGAEGDVTLFTGDDGRAVSWTLTP